jgi:transcriptional/translational regulatory protein YebC/TACO1
MSSSQWQKKKLKKATQGDKISKLYSKLVRVITLEAKKSGGNRESPGLKVAIQKARDVDMPNDNIERAIKKATESAEVFEQITYEAYGPGGVGLVIEALTTNRNKASQEIKHILSEHGTALGGIGSVTWGFTKEQNAHSTDSGQEWKPTMMVPVSEEDAEKLEALIDALEENDEVQKVFTNAE